MARSNYFETIGADSSARANPWVLGDAAPTTLDRRRRAPVRPAQPHADVPVVAAQGVQDDVVDAVTQLPIEITAAITWYMKQHNITRAELARRLEVTPGRVSQVLSGDENLTLRTIAMVAEALGAYVEVELVPSENV